jgi:hypothetical protein
MDDDVMELIVSLCTRAGMIMEDVSLIAVTMPRTWSADAQSALDQLASATLTMAEMVATARSLAVWAGSGRAVD